MISIIEKIFSYTNETLIQETLIDKIFEKFESKQIFSDEFIDQISHLLNNENIFLQITNTTTDVINGRIRQNNSGQYEIYINYPIRNSKDDQKMLVLTILHEYSHIITYKKLKDKIIQVKKKGQLQFDKYIKVFDFSIFGFDDDFNYEKAKKFLEYVFHTSEINNWAATISLSFFLDYSRTPSIESLIIINNRIINNHLNNKTELFKYRSELFLDLKSLFEIQLAVKVVNEKHYNQMFIKFTKRVIKYERRIRKLFQ